MIGPDAIILVFLNLSFKPTFSLSFFPLPLASLLFSAIWKASSVNHFAFLQFCFLGDGFDHHLLYNVDEMGIQVLVHEAEG